MDITKRQAKASLGFTKDIQLARFFRIGKGGVSIWRDDAPLPRGRQWELIARRPDLFAASQLCRVVDSQAEERIASGEAEVSAAGCGGAVGKADGSTGKRFA